MSLRGTIAVLSTLILMGFGGQALGQPFSSSAYGERLALTVSSGGTSFSVNSGPTPSLSAAVPPAYDLSTQVPFVSVVHESGIALETDAMTLSVTGSSTGASAESSISAAQFTMPPEFGFSAAPILAQAAISGSCGALVTQATVTLGNPSAFGPPELGALPSNPSPNLQVYNQGGLRIIMNEQTTADDGSGGRVFTVNAIRIIFSGYPVPDVGTVSGELVFGQARARVQCTAESGADLSITKTASANPRVGENLIYTLTVANAGPLPATGVTLVDTLPAGLTLVGSSVSQGSCVPSGNTVNCALGTLQPASSRTVTLTMLADAEGAITNTASVTANESDPNPSDNTASVSSSVAPPLPPAADLVVTGTDSPEPVDQGQPLTYLISVRNLGPQPATETVLVDDLPPNVTFVSASSGKGACTVAGDVVNCPLGTIASGESVPVTIVVTPTGGSVFNTVSVSGSIPDPVTSNNSASFVTAVTPPQGAGPADLAVVKSAAGTVQAGEQLTYTVTASNAGPNDATGVTVVDVLPEGVAFVSTTASVGSCSRSGATISCVLGQLAAGAGATITIVTSAVAQGAVTNSVSISSSNPDPDTSDNNATAQTTIMPAGSEGADLILTGSVAPEPVSEGGNLTYSLTVSNSGPEVAANSSVTLTLPNGLSFVSGAGVSGACAVSGLAVTCPMGAIGVGSSAVATATARADRAGSFSTEVTATSSVSDPQSGNNHLTLTTTVQSPAGNTADLRAAIVVSPQPAIASQPVVVTLIVSNDGPATATGVGAVLTLPSGVDLLSVETTTGTCTPEGSLIGCGFGTLAPGSSATVSVTILPGVAGDLFITAEVSASEVDPAPANDEASALVTVSPAGPAGADLELAMTACANNEEEAAARFLTVVRNRGTVAAEGVTFEALAGSGLELRVATVVGGDCESSGASIQCTIGVVQPGETILSTIELGGQPGELAQLTASVTASSADPNPADNTASAAVELLAACSVSTTELYLPAVGSSPGAAGSLWSTEVRILNHGEAPAVASVDWIPFGGDSVTSSRSYAIAANSSVSLAPLHETLGVTGLGTLRITSTGTLSASARVMTEAEGGGSYGALVPGLSMQDAVMTGVLAHLEHVPPSLGLGTRTNLGYFNPNATEVAVTWRAFRDDGSLIGARTLTLAPLSGGMQPVFDLIEGSVVGGFHLVIESDQKVFTWATVTDNQTNDTAIVLP